MITASGLLGAIGLNGGMQGPPGAGRMLPPGSGKPGELYEAKPM